MADENDQQLDEFGQPIPSQEEMDAQFGRPQAPPVAVAPPPQMQATIDPSRQGTMYMGSKEGYDQLPPPMLRAPGLRVAPPPPPPAQTMGADTRIAQGTGGESDTSALGRLRAVDRPGSYTVGVQSPPSPEQQEAMQMSQQMAVPLKQSQDAVRSAMIFQLQRKMEAETEKQQRVYGLGPDAAAAKAREMFGPQIIAAGGQRTGTPVQNPQTAPMPKVNPDGSVDEWNGRAWIHKPSPRTVAPPMNTVTERTKVTPGRSAVPAVPSNWLGLGGKAEIPAVPEKTEVLGRTTTSRVPAMSQTGTTPAPVVAPAAPVAKRTGKPDVGEVRGGYRFKGGDPSKKESWEKV